MSMKEYRAVYNAIQEAEVIRLFLKKQKERDALTLLIGLGRDKLQSIRATETENRRQAQLRRYGKTKLAAMYGEATQAVEGEGDNAH